MTRTLAAFAGFAAALAAVPASATIVVYDTPGAVQPDENVLFQGPEPSGNNAYGTTNQSGTQVTFTGSEPLVTPSNGQARVEAADGGFDTLAFALSDPALGFREVEFNIFGSGADATSVDLSFYDQFGNVFGGNYAITNGQNFFSARAFDDQFITRISFTGNGDLPDLRQVRIGGIGSLDGDGSGSTVPEPASWALMIAGFGMVGSAARRRRQQVSVTA